MGRISKSRLVSPTPAPASLVTKDSERSMQVGTSLTPVSQTHEEGSPVESSNLQPSGLLNREAMVGKFSLKCILDTGDGDNSESQADVSLVSADDPIALGLVNLSVARCLFDNFMNALNPYICQLDPILHTFAYVREQSPFLFTAMLAMSAKAFDTTMYRPLYDHAHHLMGINFCRGTKSTECAQAILILTYWKEPQDTRAWMLLGYVIRMCIDLGWHKLEGPASGHPQVMDNAERRRARNIERTCISLQTGKPYMIERTDFIDLIDSWCADSMSTANDCFLGALVKLRLETSAVFSLLGFGQRRGQATSLHDVESLLTLIDGRIHSWENRWMKSVMKMEPTEDDGSCHHFLVRFYGTHLRLQLFSLPLQQILALNGPDSSPSLDLLWVAYSSAMDLLQAVSRHSSRLYFAQDSIHVMIAYAAAFLIKLLLLAPESMVSKIESSTIDAIRNAAFAFSQQSAPPGSSCALQAGFLGKITSNLMAKRKDNSHESSRLTPATADADADQIQAQEPDWFTFEGVETTFDVQFDSDETWAAMLARAGFSTEDGVFLT
ncbi:hypothetical protein QQX98_001377 [Neonectria punicea]|uniref:Xylanolytic transcriptional activator regulatory domain-containing protein n=1 Tax=Neonectria punicea TaxID=979145 RepID=A0ABR1HNK5_9HYPO